MSDHTIVTGTARINVSWDFGVGLLSVVADDPDPDNATARSVQVGFVSRVWISLDHSGQPVDLDILDVPPILVGLVPPAMRGDPRPDRVPAAPRGAIPWLLDTDSNWMWVELIQAPVAQRMEREGRVELRLVGDQPTQLKVRVPISSASEHGGLARQ